MCRATAQPFVCEQEPVALTYLLDSGDGGLESAALLEAADGIPRRPQAGGGPHRYEEGRRGRGGMLRSGELLRGYAARGR